MTEEQSGRLVDCIDFLISEIRRLRIDVAEGQHPTLATRIETYAKKQREPMEEICTYISRYPYGHTEFKGGAAIAGYAMKMEELLIDLLDDQNLGPYYKKKIKECMGWK